MREISEIRQDITEIDREIQKLFLHRMKCAEEVADYKIQNGGKVLVPEREQELVDTLGRNIPPELKQEYEVLLRTVTRISRKHQYDRILSENPENLAIEVSKRNDVPRVVCYQGIPTSYQESAAKFLFPSAKLMTVDTFENIFQAVQSGKAEIGVVPIENSTAGTINEVYDWLVKYDLYISHSHISHIEHCLAACESTSLESVTNVYSHPQALSQCNDYILSHNFTACPVSNTAVAAKNIAELKNPSYAAICSYAAAKKYGLKILDRCINDAEKNQTRFIAVSARLTGAERDNRISIMFTLPHVKGSLAAALSIFSDHGVNLTEIHSRPLLNTPWNYRFYLDFSGNILSDNTRSLLYQLIEELPYVKLLGSYSVSYLEDKNANHA